MENSPDIEDKAVAVEFFVTESLKIIKQDAEGISKMILLKSCFNSFFITFSKSITAIWNPI